MSQPAADSEKLSFVTKLAYGSGDLGTAITAGLRAFFLLFFFTDVARLNPATAATILLIGRVWDAVNDPIIGWLSDRTVTKWGRRRPWLIAGALPFGIFFFLLWVVPPFGDTGKFFYYVIVSILLDTAYTIINVPYTALTPELTRDYDERTSLNSYRFAFSVGGALLSLVLHPIIVSSAPDLRTGYLISGLIWAIVSTVPCFIVFFFTRERPESMAPPTEEAIPLWDQIRIAFANGPYRFVIGLYLSSWLALQLVSTVLIYYLTYYMGIPEQIPLTLLAIQGSSFLFLFVWNAASHRLDKRIVYIIGASIWLVMQIALYFVRPDQPYLIIPIGILAGAGVAVAYLIPWAMMPDVIELDELKTHRRREGVFYGFMVLLQKAGIALGIFIVGRALAASGYIVPTDAVPVPVQPDSALQTIRLFVGPIPALILLGSLALAYFYPITRDRHARILRILAKRKSRQPAPLPIIT
ncbi:MAG: MFS transporter [Caldilineaceae bacterium]|nr:MFS transporter [Caldilineaceae bacterium]